MKLKPKAYSMGTCGYEILYKCAKCVCSFVVKEQLIEKGFFKPEDFDDVAL